MHSAFDSISVHSGLEVDFTMIKFWSRVSQGTPELETVVHEIRLLICESGGLLKWQVRTMEDGDAEEERLDTVREALYDESIGELLKSYSKEGNSSQVAKSLASFALKIYELMKSLNDTRPESAIPALMTQWARLAVRTQLCSDEVKSDDDSGNAKTPSTRELEQKQESDEVKSPWVRSGRRLKRLEE